jgi:hypothetical protein
VIDVVLCIRRRADIDEEEFHRYWREDHAKLVTTYGPLIGALSYTQHQTVTTGLEAIVQDARGCPHDVYDGIAVIGFDSLEDMAAKGAEPDALAAAEEMAADEARFIDHANSRIWFTERHVVI